MLFNSVCPYVVKLVFSCQPEDNNLYKIKPLFGRWDTFSHAQGLSESSQLHARQVPYPSHNLSASRTYLVTFSKNRKWIWNLVYNNVIGPFSQSMGHRKRTWRFFLSVESFSNQWEGGSLQVYTWLPLEN